MSTENLHRGGYVSRGTSYDPDGSSERGTHTPYVKRENVLSPVSLYIENVRIGI